MALLAILTTHFLVAERRNYRLSEVYKIGQLWCVTGHRLFTCEWSADNWGSFPASV